MSQPTYYLNLCLMAEVIKRVVMGRAGEGEWGRTWGIWFRATFLIMTDETNLQWKHFKHAEGELSICNMALPSPASAENETKGSKKYPYITDTGSSNECTFVVC